MPVALQGTPDSVEQAAKSAFSDAAHADGVDPDYGVVFPSNKVPQLTISVPAETWEAMLANMTEPFGVRVSGGNRGGGMGQV